MSFYLQPFRNRTFSKLVIGGITGFLLLVVAVTTIISSFRSETVSQVLAATCPFVDNDANDSDATVGTYSLNANYTVSSASTAYDCTSAAGITTFIIPTGKTVTLDSDTSTGAIAAMEFTNLQVNSGGAISANAKGCAGGVNSTNGKGPNSSNVC